MSDEPTNGGNGNGKPYAEMTPAERTRLMDFILNQQAQFFADIDGMKALQAKNDSQIEANSRHIEAHTRQMDTLLDFVAQHDRRVVRADNILRMGIRQGRQIRSRVGETERELDAIRELLMDSTRQGGENRRDIAELREVQAENARQLTERVDQVAQTVAKLAETVAKLVERNSNGAQ